MAPSQLRASCHIAAVVGVVHRLSAAVQHCWLLGSAHLSTDLLLVTHSTSTVAGAGYNVTARNHCLQVLNHDPPILTVDSFLDDETCADLIDGASASGELQQSGVGAGGVGSSGGAVNASRRTSSTLLVDSGMHARHPRLRVCLRGLKHTSDAVLSFVLAQEGSSLSSSCLLPPRGSAQCSQCASHMRPPATCPRRDAGSRGQAAGPMQGVVAGAELGQARHIARAWLLYI